jgi:hypothetical protein
MVNEFVEFFFSPVCILKTFHITVYLVKGLNADQVDQTRGPPVCVMWPAATFVDYVYTLKIGVNNQQIAHKFYILRNLC